MKILLTGAKGMLGTDISAEIHKRNIEYMGVDICNFDITDESAVDDYLLSYKPDTIIHCAAYTAVDKAETEQEASYNINVVGTKNLVKTAAKADSKFLYISTDYVFDGQSDKPYEIDSECNPINWYGYTKHRGEEVVREHLCRYFIVRASWLFGQNGNNFVKTMLKLSESKPEINVIKDQVGSPTYTQDLAKLVLDICQTDRYGIYHATNEGYCSWYEFSKKIFEYTGKAIAVNAVSSDDYKTAANRPRNSMLSKTSLCENNFERLSNWEDALRRYIEIKN